MTALLRRATAACLLIVAGLLAGCASSGTPQASAPPAAAGTAPLATSMTVAGRAWAVVAMGGSAAEHNQFWELVTRPAASSQWELATPRGVASNGGLVAAGRGGTLTVAFRPSQGLTFSPLALTSDGGKTWGTGLIDAPVAAVPDALAAGGGTMLALLGDGAIDQSAAPGARWRPLAAPGALAASAAGRQCQVSGLTAVALTASGAPLAGASCARPGSAGIFARTASGWRAAGPAVPGGRPVRVLRLTGTAGGDTALLQAGAGATASLLAAWSSDGTRWSVSAPLSAGTGQVLASGTGPGGAVWVLLPGGRAQTVSGPGASWQALPPAPRGTAALAAGPDAGGFDALAVSGGKLTVYRLTPAGAWSKTQVISVPIQYGSSG
jgi:hypothetical protein